MAGRRRTRRILAAAAVGLLALLAGVLYLRADKRQVFFEVAGEYAAARPLETIRAGGQPARLVELVNHRGEAVVTAWVRRPERLAPAYRTLLVYAGRETGRKLLDLVPARDDLVLVGVQYPFAAPRTAGEWLRGPRELRRAAFRTVAGGLLAVSFLERDERLDSARLVVLGSSLGSSFAVIHAALDPRVPRLVVLDGGGDLPLILRFREAALGHPWRGRLFATAAELLVASFEPLRYVADVAPRETIVIGARSDRVFPAASTVALYERARQPKQLRWMEGRHVSGRLGADLDEVLAELDRALGPARPAD